MESASGDIAIDADREDGASRHWRLWLLLIWAAAAIVLILWKWNAIAWFALSDTDDNMRISQVRAWLAGQGWFDLRQYKLDPPGGANIHWSRLVDLPIAGLILLIRPFFGGIIAEQAAVAIAPLLALGGALYAIALAARRLVDPRAFALAALLLFCGQSALNMWMPLRIDHHGWQLALLALAVAGSADPKAGRGGATVGFATAASMTIGLELLPHMMLAGAAIVLRWIADRDAALRLKAYGAALGGGATIGYVLFASNANRLPVCDALSPVWLSVALGAGALLIGLSALRWTDWRARLLGAVLVGAMVAAGYALAWPHCLSRLEGVSPELYQAWLKNVREAKPIYTQSWRTALPIMALPAIGLIGTLAMVWRTWRSARFAGWATLALLSLFSVGLMFWQTRAGPGAQLLGVPGATALIWLVVQWLARDRRLAVRVLGTAAALITLSGGITTFVVNAFPAEPQSRSRAAVRTANRMCPTLPALRPIAKLPAATVLTFVDFGPRLITVTRHKAIAGPYHRNGAAILDIHHAFRSVDPEVAHDVMRRHGATLLLICPGMSESTIYVAENPKGFYAQLRDGRVPAWLEPVTLPQGSPFRLWRLRG